MAYNSEVKHEPFYIDLAYVYAIAFPEVSNDFLTLRRIIHAMHGAARMEKPEIDAVEIGKATGQDVNLIERKILWAMEQVTDIQWKTKTIDIIITQQS